MSKLLYGRSLYISKHMHGQLLHSDKDDHTDPKPISTNDACVVTTSNGGVIVDLESLILKSSLGAPTFRSGQRLDDYSYLFSNLPETFPNMQLFDGRDPAGRTTVDYFTSAYQLSKYHYYKWHHISMLQFGLWYAADHKFDFHTLSPQNPSCVIQNDTAFLTQTIDGVGTFTILVEWIPQPIFHDLWIIHHTHSPNTQIKWTRAYQYWPEHDSFCYVDEQGDHHISKTQPWLTLTFP